MSEEYLRAYLKRAELAPVEESCANERALHASLAGRPVSGRGAVAAWLHIGR